MTSRLAATSTPGTGAPSMPTFLEPTLVHPSSREAAEGEPIHLAATRCTACGRIDFPARTTCSACGGIAEGHALSSRARLGSRTAVLHAPPGALVEVPYEIGVAEFDEGLSIIGLLLDGDDVTRGGELEVVCTAVDGRHTYAFRGRVARNG